MKECPVCKRDLPEKEKGVYECKCGYREYMANKKDEDTPIRKEDIKTFEYKDLNGKVLMMKVIDNKEGLVINGTDVNTGITYVLFSQVR